MGLAWIVPAEALDKVDRNGTMEYSTAAGRLKILY
jgi:hypothetical protein